VKRGLLAAAALVAAVAVLVAFSLPPARRALTPQDDGTVAGALHVHTDRSDGRSAPDEIAAIAARAGLAFVVFTDHGDGTRAPDPPAYRHGVLCLDAVEVSTNGGHYLALGMPEAPYPLGGDAWAVVEDVRRLGGFGVAAHPDSPKADLSWRDWSLPIDGVEVMNLDTSWRVHATQPGVAPKLRLAKALLSYPVRAEEAIARLSVDPTAVNRHAAAVWQRRPLVAVAGVDAHANLELRNADPGRAGLSLPIPSYEASFRTLTVRLRPLRPLTGDAAGDGAAVLDALKSGRVYVAADAVAGPPSFQFTATNDRGSAEPGAELGAAGPVTLHIRSNAPGDFTTSVLRDETVVHSARGGGPFDVQAAAGGAVYRVEVRATDRDGAPLWIVSNPIYVRAAKDAPAAPPAGPVPVLARRALFEGKDAASWSFEAAPASVAALDLARADAGAELRLRFGLAGGAPVGQYAALVGNTPGGVDGFDRIAFSARAEKPMRISVQLRVSVPGSPDERWQRSAYVDTTPTAHAIAFAEMAPLGPTRSPRPPLADVHSIVFAVEQTNTKPGTSGRLWLQRAELQR
jgi:hypothetical protein